MLAILDVILLISLAVVSSDVSSVAHNYIALTFLAVRVILIVTLEQSASLVSLYLVVLLRFVALCFALGYACPFVIPEICLGLSAKNTLSDSYALALETALVACGTGYMMASTKKGIAWSADALSIIALAIAIVGNIILAILRFSVGVVFLLSVVSVIDLTLLLRLYKTRNVRTWYENDSILLIPLLLGPFVYAVI